MIKKSRFTDEQIGSTLRQREIGVSILEACYFLGIPELVRKGHLEEDNRKLKRFDWIFPLMKVMRQEILSKRLMPWRKP